MNDTEYKCEVCSHNAYVFVHEAGNTRHFCSLRCRNSVLKRIIHNRPEGEEDE